MLDRKLLGIYLNDHLAGSTVGLELSRRARGSNKGNEYGDVLERVAKEIEEDRETLQRLMKDLGVRRDHPKVGVAWVAEKFGRLKPNGRLLSYSPLSRLVETGVARLGDRRQALALGGAAEVAGEDARLDPEELRRLAERAERQRKEVWQLRQRAAGEAFAARRRELGARARGAPPPRGARPPDGRRGARGAPARLRAA